MIDRFINEKLLYKKGRNIFVNQNNAKDYLKNPNIPDSEKIRFLGLVKTIEDYNSINILFKNYDEYPDKVQHEIIKLIDIIPFVNISDVLERLLNHRDISVRVNTLKALKHSINPGILTLIRPLLDSGNQKLRIYAMNSYYKILYNMVVNEYSALLSDPDKEIKELAYRNLMDIIRTHKDMDELRNVTYFDPELKEIELEEKVDFTPVQEDPDLLKKLEQSINKIERQGSLSFMSLLTITVLLIIAVAVNFFSFTTISPDSTDSLAPPRKIGFNPETDQSRNAEKAALKALEKGDLSKAEELFKIVNDKKIRNYYLFRINMKKEDYQKAAFYFLNLSEYSIDNLDEYISLIKKIHESGEKSLAIDIAERLLYFNSNKVNRLLLSLYEEQDFEKAVLFNRFYNINDPHILKKAISFYRNKPEKSLDFAEALLKLTVNDSGRHEIYQMICDIFSDIQQSEDLRSFLIKHIQTYPEDTFLLNRLKDLYIKTENYVDALEIIQRLIDMEPEKFSEHSIDYVRILRLIDSDKAIEYYNSIRDRLDEDIRSEFRKLLGIAER